MSSIPDALDSALVALRAAGVDSPRLDAELLLADALGTDRASLMTSDLVVAGPAVRRFQDLVRRRSVDREPVAYLLGRRAFRHIELAVDPRVLIPRPETELLVELAVAALPHGARVVDVGTGSGAVALALADERPDLEVSASDIDPAAVDVARANGERLGLEVAWAVADGLPADGWDAVVANLPYVSEGEQLAPEIARHEPCGALFSGANGLDAIRALIAQCCGRVAWIALEHGFDQGGAVRGLLRDAGWTEVASHRDLAGHERVTVGC